MKCERGKNTEEGLRGAGDVDPALFWKASHALLERNTDIITCPTSNDATFCGVVWSK